jgi:hypothetical protein
MSRLVTGKKHFFGFNQHQVDITDRSKSVQNVISQRLPSRQPEGGLWSEIDRAGNTQESKLYSPQPPPRPAPQRRASGRGASAATSNEGGLGLDATPQLTSLSFPAAANPKLQVKSVPLELGRTSFGFENPRNGSGAQDSTGFARRGRAHSGPANRNHYTNGENQGFNNSMVLNNVIRPFEEDLPPAREGGSSGLFNQTTVLSTNKMGNSVSTAKRGRHVYARTLELDIPEDPHRLESRGRDLYLSDPTSSGNAAGVREGGIPSRFLKTSAAWGAGTADLTNGKVATCVCVFVCVCVCVCVCVSACK